VVLRVLIVDDSPQFRAVAAELLDDRGFEVLGTAADADQALEAVAEEPPDAILLDINLPGADGFTAAVALSAACPAARIVLTSANVGYVPAEVLRGCGVSAFVSKEELANADLGTLFKPGGT
jgi:CheY-like chemotaxis protein